MRKKLSRLLALVLLAACPLNLPAAYERWLYTPTNLLVDKNVDELETLYRRAAKAGYTHVLLADSKFGKLGDLDARYFKNLERVKKIAAGLNLEIVPALFAIGYSNDLLWHDPNLIEGLPARDVLFVVKDGVARLQPETPVSFPGGDFSDLKKWSWKDENVKADNGAVLIANPNGANARITQKMRLQPFHQYHISVRVKTRDFKGEPEVKVLAKDALNFNHLGVKPTQDWQTHHAVFNSLTNIDVNIYFGVWGGGGGSLWFGDAKIEEVGLLNLIRRDGAPLVVNREDGTTLVEGKDFEKLVDPRMGVIPWKGSYDIYHEPPLLRTTLPDGTRLRVSYYHVATVHDDQANICPSEPRTVELLRDQAKRMHTAWGAKGYLMSHDEIRVYNWCDACQRRHLDAGAMLADNVRTCVKILRAVNPGGKIYTWSDMFDPNHNAHGNYYLARGDFTGSWEGLDRDIIIVPWYFEKRAESLKFFSDRGHRQIIAGYYDANPEKVRDWLAAARPYPGVRGVMYTTWEHRYGDLEKFSQFIGESDAGK